MVPPKNGSWQPCGDYRHLNLVTTPGQVSFAKHAGPFQWPEWLYSDFKINLVKGCHQIPVVTEDIPKTAIITPFGLFEPFQRMMDRTTDGREGVFAYMDDGLVLWTGKHTSAIWSFFSPMF
jgi:hypothetical protein